MSDQSIAQEIASDQSITHEVAYEYHYAQKILFLLIVLCLACLGSLHIARQHFQDYITNANRLALLYPEGVCQTHPDTLSYVEDIVSINGVPLPSAWGKAQLTANDLAYAQACAASFISLYQTFDFKNPGTLDTTVASLSASAKMRFYEGSTGQKASFRVNEAWLAHIQATQKKQTVRVSLPVLIDFQNYDENIFIAMRVYYQTTLYTGEDVSKQVFQDTIYLMRTTLNMAQGGTGWQIIDWTNGEVIRE